MSSKFAKQFSIPPEFPDVLKDFAREVLRNQPANIHEFAAKYFDCLANGLPTMAPGMTGFNEELDMSIEEVEAIIQDLFSKYDRDRNGYLDPSEFKNLMEDLQKRLDFPKDEIYRFLAEADMNADGMIEYEEFIPLALQIIQGMYAKRRMEQHMTDIEQHAEDLLVHGMSRDELTDLVSSIFERIDADGSGMLNKQEFVTALTSMELGLTRREINTIMFQVDQDQDGNISYKEFVPFAFELLQKMTSMRLLETEMENDELSQWLIDLFRSKDVEMTGFLSVEDLRDLLHQAMLGLSRMQIYTVISEAEVNGDGLIAYAHFIPRAVGLIRSMLSFERSIVKESQAVGAAAEEQFFRVLDETFAPGSSVDFVELMERLEATNLLNARELQASKHLLADYGDVVPVDEAKAQIWSLVKSMRRTLG